MGQPLKEENQNLPPEELKVLGDFFSILFRVDLRLKEQKKDEHRESRDHSYPT